MNAQKLTRGVTATRLDAWHPCLGVVVGLFALAVGGCDGSRQGEDHLELVDSGLATSTNEAVLGFEDAEAWSVTQGNLAVTTSQTTTEGASSLSLNPSGFGVITSRPFAVRSALTGSVSFDLFVPSDQANPYWFGATQLYLNCPSRKVYNAFIGQAELTPLETDVFHLIPFSIPEWLRPGLARGCADLSFSIALNVPWNESGTYLVDNLQLATAGDLVSPVLSCVFNRGPERYYAQFSYSNASPSPITVPVGPGKSILARRRERWTTGRVFAREALQRPLRYRSTVRR